MICPECQALSPDNAKFCIQCGTRFRTLCTSCGAPLDPGARFCGQCGAAVEATPAPAAGSPTAIDAERRQLTILFIDLVDSTQLTASLDPEEWRQIAQDYQRVCSRSIESFGGHVAQYLGDGMLCYFGYPAASEHDAENALRAALGMIRDVTTLRPVVEGEVIRLRSRVGVHTGPVVVGEIGTGATRETLALGKTTNLAARLQGVAEPDSMVISSATERLVRGRFEVEPLGERSLKGISHPVEIFGVLRELDHGVHSEHHATELTPFTGRDEDLATLVDRFELALDGTPQVVLVSGEAGIGKSRLLRALREGLDPRETTWLECRAAPYAHDKALQPIIDLVEKGLGFKAEHTPSEKLDLLKDGLWRVGTRDEEVLPMMAALLALPTEGLAELAPMPPAERRQASLEALATWLVGLGDLAPVVFALEDLHWMDPSTLEWIQILIEKSRQGRLLILATQRPQAPPAWSKRPNVKTMSLRGLRPEDARSIVRHILEGSDLEAVADQDIASRTDGNPLYIEELTNAVLVAQGGGGSAAGAVGSTIPETLHDSLMARLDAAGAAKEAAQLGACIGREFRFDVLEAVWQKPPAQLRDHVSQLVHSGLIFRRHDEQETYLFKHALVRDCAYQSLLKRTRQELHGRIADTLAGRFAEVTAQQPELLAHHYHAGDRPQQAVEYLCHAGVRERDRSAYREAVAHFQSAIAVIESVPETPERHHKELNVRMMMGRLLSTTEGYGAESVQSNASRTGALCDLIGESPAIFPALFEQWSFYMGEENPDQMEVLATKLLSLATKMGDRGLQVETELAMGMTRHVQGRVEDCVSAMSNSIELYDPERDRHHATTFGHDPCAMALAVGGTSLVYSGRFSEGIDWHERAQALADDLGHPLTKVASLAWFASGLNKLGESQRAYDLGSEALEMAEAAQFKLMICGAHGHIADSLIQMGRLDEAVDMAIASSRGYEECNSRMGCLTPRTALVKARLLRGEIDKGLEAAVQAVELLSGGSDPQHWPEVLRLEALLLLAKSPDDVRSAEERLVRGLEIADRQGSRLYALRIATTWAELHLEAGRGDEARSVLEPRLAWFDEAVRAKPVDEARAVLARL